VWAAAAIALAAVVAGPVAGAGAMQVVARASIGDWRIECVLTDVETRLCEMFAVAVVEAGAGAAGRHLPDRAEQ
jgi:hypothetical protein